MCSSDCWIYKIPSKYFTFEFSSNQEGQHYGYNLTIYNVNFEDESEIKVTVKSLKSKLEKQQSIKPIVIGDPVGQISFTPVETPRTIFWRDENSKSKNNIHSYGIYENESYRVACTIRHRANINRPLKVFLKYVQCSVDNCLSDLIDQTCQSSVGQRLSITEMNRINNFQTQFISSEIQKFDDPSIGHQYICCYDDQSKVTLAKGLTAIAREKFNNSYFIY